MVMLIHWCLWKYWGVMLSDNIIGLL